jgi:hypothetical protein
MYRYKTIIGRRLYARTLSNQHGEAKIACNILNKMTSLGTVFMHQRRIGAKPVRFTGRSPPICNMPLLVGVAIAVPVM